MRTDMTPKPALIAALREFGAGIHVASGIRRGLPVPKVAQVARPRDPQQDATGRDQQIHSPYHLVTRDLLRL
jgi:hypothetical protein